MCEQSCGRDWRGAVVVCLNQRVSSDFHPAFRRFQMSAGPGEHSGRANGHGALSVHTSNGLLGVKPAEVAWWRYADDARRYVWDVSRRRWAPADEMHARLGEVVAGQAPDEVSA